MLETSLPNNYLENISFVTFLNNQSALQRHVFWCHIGGFANVGNSSENYLKIIFIKCKRLLSSESIVAFYGTPFTPPR